MKELLDLLAQRRTWSIEELAVQLNTGVEDVKRRVEFLENAGYLRQANGCSGSCRGCAAECAKAMESLPVFWEISFSHEFRA